MLAPKIVRAAHIYFADFMCKRIGNTDDISTSSFLHPASLLSHFPDTMLENPLHLLLLATVDVYIHRKWRKTVALHI